jgi:c-di-AMP phosphodiesterase-like protein
MSLIQRGGPDGKTIFQKLIITNSPLATTAVTYEEQMRGWLDLIARATKFDAQVRDYQLLHRLTLNYQKVRSISMKAQEFDQKFDDGENITEFLDVAKAKRFQPEQSAEQAILSINLPIIQTSLASQFGLPHAS